MIYFVVLIIGINCVGKWRNWYELLLGNKIMLMYWLILYYYWGRVEWIIRNVLIKMRFIWSWLWIIDKRVLYNKVWWIYLVFRLISDWMVIGCCSWSLRLWFKNVYWRGFFYYSRKIIDRVWWYFKMILLIFIILNWLRILTLSHISIKRLFWSYYFTRNRSNH